MRIRYNGHMIQAGQMAIRNYRPADILELHRIDQVCFDKDIAFSRVELLFYLNLPGSIAHVAVMDEQILGFVVGRLEPPLSAHILTLDVVPEARRHKIGTQLMDVLHGEFQKRGVATISLEVSTENEAARQLYERLKYRRVGRLRGYYNGRTDAYRMVRILRDEGVAGSTTPPLPDSPSASSP